MPILILSFFILFAVLAFRRLDWAVMFLIAALPSYLIRFNVLGIPTTLLEGMILIVFIVWLAKNFKFIINSIKLKIETRSWKSDNYCRYPFDWEMVLLLVISLIAVGVGGFSNAAFGIWKAYFFEPSLLYIVLFNLLIKEGNDQGLSINKLKIVIMPLLFSALAVSVLAFYQKFTGNLIGNPLWSAEATRRVVSFFGYPNAVGLYLGPLILLFTGLLASKFKIKEFKFFIPKIIFISSVIILSFLSIIFAKSVGASLGVLAGFVVFGLMAGRKSRMATLAILLIVIAGTISFTPARQTAIKYLTLNDFSGQVRKSQWDETWKMLKDGKIITGAGLANYQKAVAPYHHEGIWIKDIFDPNWLTKIRTSAEFRQKNWQPLEIYLYPHDIFLNFWSELGLAGMLLFIWIIGKYFYLGIKMFKEKNYLILGLLGAMTAIVVQGLVDVPYFKNDLSVMFWILIALMGILALDNKTPQPFQGAGQEATVKKKD